MILALALLQIGLAGGIYPETLPTTQPAPAAPTACPQYQHDVSWHTMSNCHSVPYNSALMQCNSVEPAQCVDDMHAVTETEWQALLSQIRELERERITLPTAPENLIQLPNPWNKECPFCVTDPTYYNNWYVTRMVH